uniref:Neprosin PEP catalytic domain-containing protein n=1 Tax=Leersia perrieri TaxID=77586 RepID=A0A0D9XNR5_9ORYZ
MYKQPSLKNPLLKDHKIQLKPSVDPPKMMVSGRNNSHKFAVEQAWRRSGSCPEGSIPIRRTPASANATIANQTLPFFSLYGRPAPTNITIQDEASVEGNYSVEIAAAYAVNGPYHGARASIPVWKVEVQPFEFSKSYLLVASPKERDFIPIRGKDPPDINNQIALGLAVYPQYFGDGLPRLYLYSTNDGGVKSKCFNLECSFVQTSNKVALGALCDHFSTIGGTLYSLPVGIYRDAGPAVMWVSVQEEPIGYFHESAFTPPFIESFHNEMGGHVLDRRADGKHTLTPMGSGMYPSDGLHNAACISYYLGIAYTGADQVDDPVNTIVTHPKCYDVKDYGPDLYHPGTDVAFGGPGGYDCDAN